MPVTCRHWIGSDEIGHVCGVETGGPRFCDKHLPIERARAVKQIEKQRAFRQRKDEAFRKVMVPRLPQMRVQLEQAESEYARRTASRVNDRAAYGGAAHPAVQRAQRSLLSDTNVARVAELDRIITKLRADIRRAEAVA